MPRKSIIMLIGVLTVFFILNIFRPGGLMAYLVPSLCWTALAVMASYLCSFKKFCSWANRRVTLMAFLIAVFQIFILIDSGLINGFGQSPLSFTPTGIATNLMLVSSTMLGMELSRAYLTRNLNRKRPTLTLVTVTLLYTFINTSIFPLLNFQDPLVYTKFIGATLIPVLSENLLASYLTMLSGPLASIAYRGPMQAFKWFCPILPNLSWGYESLIGVITPTVGFIIISTVITPIDLRRAGIPTQERLAWKPRKTQASMKGWMTLSILLVLIVWVSTGLLGLYPTIIASGSMRPTLNVGDMALVVSVDPLTIKVGDIIQYRHEGEMILHRVVDIQQQGNTVVFITKGDANPSPDSTPVTPSQIVGKMLIIIPKIGWVSIAFKTLIMKIVNFFTTLPFITSNVRGSLLTLVVGEQSVYFCSVFAVALAGAWGFLLFLFNRLKFQ